MKTYIIAITATFLVSAALAEQPMTIDFSFKGTRGCTGTYSNPEIRIRHAPAAGARVSIRLIGPKDQELGGQEIPLPSNGSIPAGTIRTFAPCKDGFYTYQAIVKARDGAVLSKAEMPRFFPIE